MLTLKAGWNLLSLPVDPHNDTVSALYPGAAGPAFTYSSGGYGVQSTVTVGTGYWLRFIGPESLSFTGAGLPVDSIPVHAGWNLIGSVSTDLPVASLTSTVPGMITSKFFGYAGSYVIADTIHAGSGYWVKCNQSGTIILSSPTAVLAGLQGRYPIRINAGVELPPPPPGQQDPAAGLPKAYALDQAFPNPFNPSTTIRYQLPVGSYVRLTVYDVLGRVVTRLVDGREEAGYKQYEWNAGELASGVYIYRLEASDLRDPRMSFTQSKKVILLK